jgi:hypothetical protein
VEKEKETMNNVFKSNQIFELKLPDEDIVNTTPTNTNSTVELFETSTSTQIQPCSAGLLNWNKRMQ